MRLDSIDAERHLGSDRRVRCRRRGLRVVDRSAERDQDTPLSGGERQQRRVVLVRRGRNGIPYRSRAIDHLAGAEAQSIAIRQAVAAQQPL
jgi:hypothetical protein